MTIFDKKLFYIEDDALLSLKMERSWWGWPRIKKKQIIHPKLFTLIRNRGKDAFNAIEAKRATMMKEITLRHHIMVVEAVHAAIDQAVRGSESLPSQIQIEGRKSLTAVVQKLVTEVQTLCRNEYLTIIDNNLAQMLIFAREEMAGTTTLTSLPLPLGTRFVIRQSGVTSYVIEEPPRVRTIIWDNAQLRLSFPYCVFFVKYDGNRYTKSYFYFRNGPIESLNDRLYLPPLPDISEDGQICFPDDITYPDERNPVKFANSLQTIFWNSNFRSEHWGGRIGTPMGKQKWRTLTDADPNSICQTDWIYSNMIKDHNDEGNPTPNPNDAMSRLAFHNTGLARRVATVIGEKLIAKFAASDEVKIAEEAFAAALADVVAKSKITKQVENYMRSRINDLVYPKNLNDVNLNTISEAITLNLIADMEAVYE